MRFLKPLAWTAGVLALLVGAYAWAGYWLAPRLVKSKLPPAISAATGLELTLGEVVVKPFALSADLRDVALTEPDGTALLAAQRLFIDARLAALWRRGVVLEALVLEQPALNFVLREDGSVNLATAFESKSPPPPPDERSRPLPVSIDDIRIQGGVIDAADERRAPALRHRLEPINVRVQNLTTSAGDEGSFNITGRDEDGGQLTLKGQLAMRPFALSGSLEVKGLSARTAWDVAGRYERIAPPAGSIDFRTLYDIAATDEGLRIALDALDAEARELAVRPAGGEEDWVTVAALSVAGASVDVRESRVTLPELRVQGLEVDAWMEAGGEVNLTALAPAAEGSDPTPADDPALAQAPAAQAATAAAESAPAPEAAAPPAPAKSWRVEAPMLRVTGSRIAFEDRTAPQPVRYLLAPLELDIDGYASDAPAIDVALRSDFNETGKIAVAGQWKLDDSGGAFTVDAESLPIVFLQPYLDRTTDLVLKDGQVSVEGKVDVGDDAGRPRKIGFEGSAALARFHSVDRALQEDFIKFGQLAASRVSYASAPARLRVRDLLARGAFFKLVISPDSTTNIADVLSPPRLRKDAPAAPKGAAAAAGESAAKKASAAGAARPGQALDLRIDTLRVVDSAAFFADLSIRPNFSTGIEELGGVITGLSSDPAARAEVMLDGKVDRYAPVEVRGQVNLLSSTTFTDLTAEFSNIELPTFTPYSGKFMGYQIEKGKLNAHFHYLIEDRKLDARHRFTLDQFTLGERVESDDAVKIPMKLAVALLKDRNGVIDIDLPVSGSLDDPSFRVGPLVWKALRNLLVKIVTAPFALIGSLFGAGEEVRFVDFPYGSATLDAAAREQLANVGKALTERPQLKLEVPLVFDAARDRAALTEQRMVELLGGEQVSALRSTDAGAYQKALDGAFEALTGERRAPRPEREKDEAKESHALRTIEAGEAALRERIVIEDTALAELAKQRSEAVRDVLVSEGGLDPGRIFVVAGEAAAEVPGGVRLALGVE